MIRTPQQIAVINKTTTKMEEFAEARDWNKYYEEKQREFARRKEVDTWPSQFCTTCAYVACTQCGAAPLPETEHVCRKCGAPTAVRRACCQRDYHHVGDCCIHCGNDERTL